MLVGARCLVLLLAVTAQGQQQPHIIFMVADDMGWNDVSFHGADQIPTYNLDALGYNGVILNSHYVLPVCTPTRSALMTGRYPIHTGMQGVPMFAAEPRGLPFGKILPEYLKDLGYVTRAVGKWHLGFYKKEYTPTYRGFDSHVGYWTGFTSYYDHITEDTYPGNRVLSGYDFRRNMDVAWDLSGKYATDVFTDESVKIIHEHDKSRPLFLYLSHLAAHAGNDGKLLEAPQEEVDKFRHIPEANRRTYAAMISKMDESVGRVVEALQDNGMLNNSIIVFISDNGAPTVGMFRNWGSNFPFRGIKATLWEGGVRGVGLIWSPLLSDPGRVSEKMMHVSDWLPTLYSAAGGDVSNLTSMDGVNQWRSLVEDTESPRTEVLLNIDEKAKTAAYRFGQWKLVIGSFGKNGSYDEYFGEHGRSTSNPVYNISSLVNSQAWKSISASQSTVSDNQIQQLRKLASVTCSKGGSYQRVSDCNPSLNKMPCLFNVLSDPCETKNVADYNKNLATNIYNRLVYQRQTLVRQLNVPFDVDGADPTKFNNTWSPWME
ncbi:arylsulfatase B-like [Periplaneta americana]|uniref:arylsulfatase B-like n=1 Tax=Periplaneta americana TaxID=6978 RepID=UPI0037E95049